MSSLILVADDDPFNLQLLQELCDALGYAVLTAETGDQVLDLVSRQKPDLLLLDLDMPGKPGFELMEIFRDDPQLTTIPIIVVTALGDVDARSRGLELGAEDYLTKPYRVFEIQQRIRNVLRIQAAEVRAKLAERQASGPEALASCGTSEQLAATLEYETTRATRYRHALSLIFVELIPGPAAPQSLELDELVVTAANTLRGCIRNIDHLFRSDETEFAVILPETDASGARNVRDRVLQELPGIIPKGKQGRASYAVNVGVATYPDPALESVEELRQAAFRSLLKERRRARR